MSGPVFRSETFLVDVACQFAWYLENAGENVAWRFVDSVDATLSALARHPGLGRERRFSHPRLKGIRSIRVDPPFDRILIFYRATDRGVEAWRLMSGTRDVSSRLSE